MSEDVLLSLFEFVLVGSIILLMLACAVYMLLAAPIRFVIGIVIALWLPPIGGSYVLSILIFQLLMFMFTTAYGLKGTFTGIAIGSFLSWLTTRNWK